MKIKSPIPGGLVLACVLAVSAASLSQDTEVIQDSSSNIDSASPVEPLPITGRDVASFSSLSEAQLAALTSELDAAPLIPFAALSPDEIYGNFFSLQNPDWPPLPADLSGSSMWRISEPNNAYLLNDVNFDYQAASRRSLARGGMQPMELSIEAPDFGTNLYLAQMSLAAGYLTGIASNTLAGVSYEIMSNADLTATTNWNSTGLFIFGSEETNWTALGNLPMSLTNKMFFKLRSWADDGSGLPIWWQMAFFGVASGVDPYDDPAGDGWNNLQKFQNGWNPNTFYTPATPQVSTALNNNSGFADVNWLPSPGPVTGYTLKKEDAQTGLTTDIDLSADTQSFEDDLSAETPLNWWTPQLNVTYSIQAHYPNGNSAWGAASLVTTQGPVAKLVTGPQGRLYVAMPGLPSDLSEVRIYRIAEEQTDLAAVYDYLEGDLLDALDFPLDDGFFEVSAADITNGVFMLPDSFAPPFIVHDFWVQTVRSNGIASTWTDVAHTFTANHLLVDARSQLKDNLRFLLRSATELGPFAFQVVEGNEASGYQRSTFSQPANCAYAGFYSSLGGSVDFDELQPIHDNCFYRNFVFDQDNLASDGFLNTGCYYEGHAFGYNDSSHLNITNFPAYFFDVADFITTTNPTVPASLLTANQSTWILPTGGDGLGNVAAGDRNFYGLPYLSVKDAYVTNSQLQLTTYNPGDAVPDGICYRETAQPGFQAVGYYFARVGTDPLPGQDGFSPTNTSPPMIATFSSYSGYNPTIAGYAKLAVTNGYSGVYAYLGQYFDQAYQIADNGVVTTNTTGILSPYGDFLPTQPGAAALVTLPDIDTGARGTCVVYSVSLQLDANHDGSMDLSFNGADATTPANPMFVWVNNNYDRWFKTTTALYSDYEQDDLTKPQIAKLPTEQAWPDYQYSTNGFPAIPCARDLEDYFRLWTPGLSNAMSAMPASYTVQLALYGSGQIRIFQAFEPDGGTNYLLDETTVSNQVAHSTNLYVGLLTADAPLVLTNWMNEHFIFCGVTNGSAQVELQILDGNHNYVADAQAYLQINDIKQMYERWTVGDNSKVAPVVTAMLAANDLPVSLQPSFQYSSPTDTNTPYILHVHGYNMPVEDKDRFAETEFKRLYWQGYRGRFGSFRWPTTVQTLTYVRAFDDSEFNGWNSAPALLKLLKKLDADYPGNVYLTAHSHGNVVAGEALRLATNQVVNTYIAMQAAVPSHSYDSATPYRYAPTLPDFYGHYWMSNSPSYFNGSAGAGTYVNFYNTNDFALRTLWEPDQDFKPDAGYILGQDDNFYYGPDGIYEILLFPVDGYRIFAYCDPATCYALGAQADVGGAFLTGTNYNQVELDVAPYSFKSDHIYHSGEFRSDYAQRWQFWNQVLIKMKLKQ